MPINSFFFIELGWLGSLFGSAKQCGRGHSGFIDVFRRLAQGWNNRLDQAFQSKCIILKVHRGLRLRQPVHSPPNQKESHKTGAGRRIQTDSELTYNPLNPICKRKIQYIGAGVVPHRGRDWRAAPSPSPLVAP
jgi:hypothetical protein